MARPIVMPSLGMYTSEGTVSAWLREPGSQVAAGDPVVEITTEKANYEVQAPETGILHPVVDLGTILSVQALIGYVLAAGESPPVAAAEYPPPSAVGGLTATASAPAGPIPVVPPGEVKASPVARRLAAEHGVDLRSLTGTGPGGRIVEADILAAVAVRQTAMPAAEVATSGHRVRQRVPLTGVRRTIAERLRHSLSTATPVTLIRDVDAEALVSARGQLGERLESGVPYDALFVKLLAAALRERPDLNAVVEQDEILVLEDVHVGFAVAVAGGLVVPVVRDADSTPFEAIMATVRELTDRARVGQLRPPDVAGGTVTITNLGGHGIDAFTPIINPPQSAILGIGRILPRAVVRDGQLVARQTCTLSLTFDHRVADGVPAAQLLDAIARLMNDEQYLATLA